MMAATAVKELELVIDQLRDTQWPAEVFDDQLRLVWVSDGLRSALGDPSDEELGYGKHILLARLTGAGTGFIPAEDRRRLLLLNAAYWMHGAAGGRDALVRMAPPDLQRDLAEIEPAAPPSVMTWEIPFHDGDLQPMRISCLATRLHARDGRAIGSLIIYGPGLSPRIMTMLTRGDQSLFERMERLAEPARRRAAILFADLEGSSDLSRMLATAAYFELIRQLRTAIDAALIRKGGIVGKHAGDGITAFFPADDQASGSGEARAAIEAARAIGQLASEVAERHESSELLGDRPCRFNIGIHWGPDLYLGQIVTDGRLEVTAVGDEVNQAARIEQVASGGQILASKSLLEELAAHDASELGIQVDRLTYQPLADLAGDEPKAARDAGTIAVTEI